jgi:drug/metabolite transporter (DMT)-like permease
MAQEVEFGGGGVGKVRSFWVGLGLAVITFGIYYYVWYYLINDELKDIGIAKGDQNLAESSPTMSVIAVLVGGFVLIPPFISIYNTGNRIRRAQLLTGVDRDRAINPVAAFLLAFPGGILIIPAFIHYWYITKHQNAAVRAAGGLPPWDQAELPAEATSPVA